MERFRTLDVDRSGTLSLDEMRVLIPGDEQRVQYLLEMFDTNGDGELQMKGQEKLEHQRSSSNTRISKCPPQT